MLKIAYGGKRSRRNTTKVKQTTHANRRPDARQKLIIQQNLIEQIKWRDVRCWPSCYLKSVVRDPSIATHPRSALTTWTSDQPVSPEATRRTDKDQLQLTTDYSPGDKARTGTATTSDVCLSASRLQRQQLRMCYDALTLASLSIIASRQTAVWTRAAGRPAVERVRTAAGLRAA